MLEPGALGKKIFFLYPPPVLNEVVEELARKEFEVYLVRDHEKLLRILPKEPDSIVFINIDEGIEEPQWADYVKKLREDEKTASVGVGIVSMNEDHDLAQKYLMDLQVPCGFVVVKIGIARTLEILTKTLEANEARGRRHFVRAACAPGMAQCLLDLDGRQVRGELSDLSSAGMAMTFDSGITLKPGTILRGLALSVKGVRLLADGFVAARREGDGNSTHIVMFDPATLDEKRRDKLRGLVSRLNQARMDKVLESA
jgi:hypothetical protein